MNDKPQIAVPPPPPRQARRGLIHNVPAPEVPTDNMEIRSNVSLQDLNFKVDPDFHRAFKVTAVIRGMSMRDLVEASFQCWVEQYGDASIKAMLPKKKLKIGS